MFAFRLFFVLFAAVLITACGGGSGGGNGGGNGGGGSSGTPPLPVAVNYSGNSSPAIVDKTNSAGFAATVISARLLAVFVESLWIDTTGADGAISETVNGIGGGTASITGNLSGGTGWLEANFNAFSDGNITVAGRYIQRITARQASMGGFVFSTAGPGSLEFDDLSLTAAGQTLELRGSVTISGGNFEKATFDLLVTEPATGEQAYYQDLVIDYSSTTLVGQALRAQDFSGTVYDGVLGSVTVTALEPFTDLDFFEPAGYLIANRGGRLRMTSAGSTVEFSSLSRAWAALEMDVDGDGSMDEALRISWGAVSGLPELGGSVRSGPIANAGDEVLADVGGSTTIHALFSHDDDGDWLTSEWRILAKPLDSALTLADPATAAQSFTPDVEGEYLFGVTVSDGVEATRTAVRVKARLTAGSPQSARTRTGGLEIAPPIVPGVPAIVDGRSSMNRPYVPGFGSWWVDGPGNWTLTELDSPEKQEFVTDSNGVYQAQFRESTTAGAYLNSDGYVDFLVGAELPLIDIEYPGDTNARTVILADYDSDGRDDIVVGVASFMNTGVRVVQNLGNGGWQMGPQADGPYGEIAVGDLNGDGRLDIATGSTDGVHVSYQQADGMPGDMVLEPFPMTGCMTSHLQGDIGIGDIDGDGLDDLFAVLICSQAVAVWRQNGAGGLDAATLELAGEPIRYGRFEDVNGDNRTDALLGLNEVSPAPAQAVIALAQPDGTLAIDERFDRALSNVPPAMAVGDVSGDGLDDVVLVNFGNMTVLERQQDGSTIESLQLDLSGSGGLTDGSNAFVEVVDIDDDGDNDILMCSGIGRFTVLSQSAPDDFSVFRIGDCVNDLNGLPDGFALADFNDDGQMDIVLSSDDPINQSAQEAFFRILVGGASNYAKPVN